MSFRKICLTVIFSIAICTAPHAQAYKENTPLNKFLQENFDSTIIYYSWSNWYIYPNYLIISKKGNSVYFFTYKSTFAHVLGRYYPADLHRKFMKEESKFRTAKPDTNVYFLPINVDYRVKTNYWTQANSFNIWYVEQDKYEPGGCDIDDSTKDTYYLITKAQIKVLDYYDPDFFESCKPKNINRQNVIKTREVIKKIFAD